MSGKRFNRIGLLWPTVAAGFAWAGLPEIPLWNPGVCAGIFPKIWAVSYLLLYFLNIKKTPAPIAITRITPMIPM
jgi:hypothetical protein